MTADRRATERLRLKKKRKNAVYLAADRKRNAKRMRALRLDPKFRAAEVKRFCAARRKRYRTDAVYQKHVCALNRTSRERCRARKNK